MRALAGTCGRLRALAGRGGSARTKIKGFPAAARPSEIASCRRAEDLAIPRVKNADTNFPKAKHPDSSRKF